MAARNKFQLGQKVRIVKNLGVRNFYGDRGYYHGGSIKEVPLRTPGVVCEVRPNEVVIKMENDKRWVLDFGEVELINHKGADNPVTDILKNSIKHPLSELFRDSSVFVLDNKVYSNCEETSNNSFSFNGRYFNLAEASGLEVFDELFFDRFSEVMSDIGRQYAEEVKREFKSDELDQGLDTPQLIYKQVIPYLRTDGYSNKIAGVLGVQNANGNKRHDIEKNREEASHQLKIIARELYHKVEEIIEEVKEEGNLEKILENKPKRRTEKQKDLDTLLSDEIESSILDSLLSDEVTFPYSGKSLIGKIVNLRDFAIIDGTIYSLSTSRHGEVQIEGQKYEISRVIPKKPDVITDTKDLEERFYLDTSKDIRIQALKKHLSIDRLTEFLQDGNAEIHAMKGKREYSEGDFGFLERNGTYYVYLTVPEFALKSFDRPGTYYYHDKMRIGQAVHTSRGKISYYDPPIAIDNNGHMYMHDNSGEFIGICFGSHSIPSSGKDNGEVIAKRLRSTRDMMLFGYREFPESYSKYRRNPMRLEEVKRKGILITNPYGKN